MNNPTHIPHGFTCCSCIHAGELCYHLDFKSMRVIDTDKNDETKIVKCDNFRRIDRRKTPR